MPQTVYNKVTDEAGNVTFVETEVATPEEVSALQARLKAANDEAAAKRHELKRIKEAQPAQASADQDEDTPAAPVTTVKPTQPAAAPTPALSEDAVVEKTIERLNAQKAQTEAKAKEISDLLAKHALPASYAETLAESTNPAKLAETISRDRLQFAPAHAGTQPTSSAILPAAVKAFRSLGMKHPDDPEK
jgi:hypothetical protein